MSAPQTLEDFTDPSFGIVAHMEANHARLVEQNRELLTALQFAGAYFAECDKMRPEANHGGEGKRVRETIRAAIAKAEGQA